MTETKNTTPYIWFGDVDLDGVPDSVAYVNGKQVYKESVANTYPPISNQSYFMWKVSLGILFKDSGVCKSW